MSALRRASDMPATIADTAGEAWEHDLDGALASIPDPHPPSELTVASWLIRAAWAHPLWSWYWLGCVSLRDVPGAPPATIYLPGATHEVFVYALQPDKPVYIDDYPKRLEPANFHGQFIEPDDAAAAARMRRTVQDIVAGRLNPDTDARSAWVARFSDSNLRGGTGAQS